VQAKCTVLVIQHHCGQTFSTHLGGGEGRSPVRRGCGMWTREKNFLTIFVKFWKQIVGLLRKKFLEIGTFWSKVIRPCMSRREIKIDVWKYICPIDLMIGHMYFLSWGWAQFWRKSWITRTVHFACSMADMAYLSWSSTHCSTPCKRQTPSPASQSLQAKQRAKPLTSSIWYGVATISRLFRIIGLFCKRALQKRLYSAKKTYNFKELTNHSHPIRTNRRPECLAS